MFAALIIEPRNRSHYDHDYTLVYFDDYNKSQTAGQIVWQRIQQSFGREVPPPVMVNGKEEEKLEAARGQTGFNITGPKKRRQAVNGVEYKLAHASGWSGLG